MSNDEQDAIILRVVKQRAEAKKSRGLIESELREVGKSLVSTSTSRKWSGSGSA